MKSRLSRERDEPLCRLSRETKRKETMGDEVERGKHGKRREGDREFALKRTSGRGEAKMP